MNKPALIGLLGIIVIVAGLFFRSQIAGASVGNLNIYEGTVDVVRGSQTTPGKTGFSIRETDVIKVGLASRVSIILKDGSVIRLEADSEVLVAKLTYKESKIDDASFRLISGKMWSKVEPLQDSASWQVETPTVVAAVRGTQFNTRYTNKSSDISVYSGKVGVALLKNLTGEKLLLKDNQFILRDEVLDTDFAKDLTVIDLSQYNEWIIFNLVEDAKLEGQEFRLPTTATTSPKSLPKKPPEKLETKATTTQILSPKPVEEKPRPKMLERIDISYTKIPPIEQGRQFTYQAPRYPTLQLKTIAYYDDNSNSDVTSSCSWTVSGTAGGSVTSDGLYTPEKEGDVTIEAVYNNKSAQATILIP